ncbi:ATP-binding protein [Polaromonas sp.]|uniref:AAA family ATPase n=1 Tax=Polaromonas sp. TaxID=1869339 RepID=UPI00326347EC
MKITEIHVENFLGIRSAQVLLGKPVTLFAGRNHSGKSSLKEAVRMALTGESVRVSLKKDYPALVNDLAKAGYAQVVMEGASATIGLPKGNTSTEGEYQPSPYLPYLLDAQRFAGLDEKLRRTFLFGLMGLKLDLESVAKRMLEKGLDKEKVGRTIPLLRTGFEGACADAKEKATTAKGAWKAITTEAYGSVKAKTWKAAKPDVDAAALQLAQQKVASVDTQLADANQNLGALQADSRNYQAKQTRIESLQELAGLVERRQAKVTVDEADLATWETKVAETEAKASGAAPTKPLTCPHCSGLLELRRGDNSEVALFGYEAPTAVRDTEAAAALPEYKRSRDLMLTSLTNAKRDLQAATGAAAELQSLTEGEQAVAPAAAALEEAVALVADLNTRRTAAAAALQAAQAAQTAAAAADKKTADAAGHHADVEQWDAIANALAPDGIPSELLAEALAPINDRLAQSARDAEWPPVVIEKDMRTTFGGRDYGLLSESEQWQVDAMVAEAISHKSGLKLLVLDRFDVLDVQGRADLLAWFEVLATSGELETALLFGTLKALPSALPAGMAAEWIHAGSVGEIKQAA